MKHYRVSSNLYKNFDERETKLAEAHQDLVNKRGTHKVLPPINTGAIVWVQNQATLKWDRSGTVIEVTD